MSSVEARVNQDEHGRSGQFILPAKSPGKIQDRHLSRLAVVYIRQSTQQQVLENRESRERQYALVQYAQQLGWSEDRVLIIDEDQGVSGKSAENRPGFQRLMTEVTLKHVGLVLGLELSRLSRSCKDWHHLIEVCGLFGTLLCDEDSIYDPLDSNDRLLLGMRGAMSEFELVTLRNRLIRGVQNKASRGELFLSVPIGYVKLPTGEIAIEPDEQAKSMVDLVFAKFEETGSVYGAFRYLIENDLKMGFRIHKGAKRGELEWRLATPARVMNILKHPIYAGAYAYGMRRNCKMHQDVENADEKGWFLRPEDMSVLIKDKVPSYISWEQYISNQERIRENRSHRKSKGIPRRGEALLAGLVTCGRCQRRMTTSYKSDKLPSYACHEFMRSQKLGGYCGRIAAGGLDQLIATQVLRAISPAALELSLAAVADVEKERGRLHHQWTMKLERARYACDRAERQYQAVEPENRLVVRALEHKWESSLNELQKLEEDYQRFMLSTPSSLSDAEKVQIQSLSESIPELWKQDSTPPEDRKQIIRTLIDRVVVTTDQVHENVNVTIVWHGGFQSQHAICKAVGSYAQLKDYDRLCNRIRELHASGYHHEEIAAKLNEEGFVPPRRRGKFNRLGVGDLIRRLGLRGELFQQDVLQSNEWWIPDLAAKLGVIQQKVHYWAKQGWVHSRKTTSGKHWIAWADEEELKRLKKLGRQRGSYTAKKPPTLVTPKERPSR